MAIGENAALLLPSRGHKVRYLDKRCLSCCHGDLRFPTFLSATGLKSILFVSEAVLFVNLDSNLSFCHIDEMIENIKSGPGVFLKVLEF